MKERLKQALINNTQANFNQINNNNISIISKTLGSFKSIQKLNSKNDNNIFNRTFVKVLDKQDINKDIQQKNNKINKQSLSGQDSQQVKSYIPNINILYKNQIKAFNYTHSHFNPLIDKPQVINSIVQAIPQVTKIQDYITKKNNKKNCHFQNTHRSNDNSFIFKENNSNQNDIKINQSAIKKLKLATLRNKINNQQNSNNSFIRSQFSSPRNKQVIDLSQYKEKQRRSKYGNTLKNYAISQQRRQLSEITNWFTAKLNTCQNEQIKGQSIITQRMHTINMVYNQVTKVAGKYSIELKNLLSLVQQEYHIVYNYLFQCLAKQNQNMKKNVDQTDQKNIQIVQKYQKLLLQMRTQHDKKCAKVIQNFHQSVQQKRFLQTQLDFYKRVYENQRVKTQFVQSGLSNLMWILLNLSPSQSKVDASALNNSSRKQIINTYQKKNYPQAYYKWCANLLYSTASLNQKTQIKKISMKKNQKGTQLKNKNQKHLYNLASKTIVEFMVQNDANLSIDDAKNLLRQFAPQKNIHSQIKQTKGQEKIQQQNKNNKYPVIQKIQSMKVPDLAQLYNKFSIGIDRQVQVNFVITQVSQSTQTVILKSQKGTNPHKKFKTAAINTQDFTAKRKLKIERVLVQKVKPLKKVLMNGYTKKVIQSKNIIASQTNISQKSIKIVKLSSQKSQKKSIKSSKRTSKVDISFEKIPSQKSVRKNKKVPSIKIKPTLKKSSKYFSKSMQSQQNQRQNLNQSKLSIVNSQAKNTQRSLRFADIQNKSNDISELDQSFQKSIEKFQIKQINSQEQIKAINKFIKTLPNRKIMKSHKFLSKGLSCTNSQEDQQIEIFEQNLDKSKKKRTGIIVQRDIEQILNEGKIGRSECHIKFNKQVEYLCQQEVQKKQLIKEQIVKQKIFPKKKTIQIINKHNFHLQIFHQRQQKILQQINEKEQGNTIYKLFVKDKNFAQLKRIKTRLFLNKRTVQANNKNMQALKKYTQNFIQPVIKQLCLLYDQNLQKQKIEDLIPEDLVSEDIPDQKSKTMHSNYYHKLIPLAYFLIKDKMNNGNNFHTYTQKQLFGGSKTNLYCNTNIDIRAFRIFRQCDPRYKVLDQVIRGGTVQLDILIKTFYYLQIFKQKRIKGVYRLNEAIQINLLQERIHMILSDYFQKSEIEIIFQILKILAVKGDLNQQNLKRNHNFMSLIDILEPIEGEEQYQQKPTKINKKKITVNIYWILIKILRAYKQKKANIQRKYSTINQNFAKNSQCVSYDDIYYFLQILPLRSDHTKMILKKLSFYTVFWERKEGGIPKDRLFFVFDMFKLISGSSIDSKRNIIQEYIVHKAQFKYKKTLTNVRKCPDKLVQFVKRKIKIKKIPSIFKKSGFIFLRDRFNCKVINSIITLLFHELFESQNDTICMPILFNGLLSMI